MVKAIYLYFAALLLCILLPLSSQLSNLPAPVTAVMASRDMRTHHFVWHNIRNLWSTLNASTQTAIGRYGWAPKRPALDGNKKPLTENNSGRDFLYFHRRMIQNVNRLMKKYGYPSVTGFKSFPAANDKTYPMQKTYNAPTAQLTKLVKLYKSNDFYIKLKSMEKNLTNNETLKKLTLGQLGAYIEFTSEIHQGIHFRWSESNKLMRVKNLDPIPLIDRKWDVTSSNWLVDVYSSQMNPWFWKIHGWIDDRITDWQKANGLSSIDWGDSWVGGDTANLPSYVNVTKNPDVRFLGDDMHDMDMADMDMEDMDDMEKDDMALIMTGMEHAMNMTALLEVEKILIGTGKSCDYFNELGNINEAPEHFSEDGDEKDGSCKKKKK